MPAVLAPLAGVSDLPFRLITRRFGCPLAFTEMVNARALGLANARTLNFLRTSPLDAPLGVQLLAREPHHLVEAFEVLSRHQYALVDLNAACPVRKVTRKGEGAALLKTPEVLERLVRTLVAHSPVPVTVKIRSGWDGSSINAPEIARRVADAGADAVCVHGRTRNQGYGGKADLNVIRAVKEAVSIPVIASGDVFSAASARRMWAETGCDAVMVARGALGNPWIFREIAAVYAGVDQPVRPAPEELKATMREHLGMCVQFLGERMGVINFRKFFIWYTRGLPNARLLRPKAVLANTARDVAALIDESAGLSISRFIFAGFPRRIRLAAGIDRGSESRMALLSFLKMSGKAREFRYTTTG